MQRTKRRALAGVVATLLCSLGLVAATASPALAANCLGGGVTGNYQVGWSTLDYGGAQPNNGIEGSSSYIYTRSTSAFCAEPLAINFSTSWNMVQDQHGHYAQAGFFSDPTQPGGGSCQRAFAQQTIPTSPGIAEHDVAGCLTIGSRHAYRNLMVLTAGAYHVVSSYDGAALLTSAYNPFITWTTTTYGFDIDFDAETYYYTTAVEGTASTPTNYTSMGVQFYDDTLHTTCAHAFLGRVSQNNPPYASEAASDCSDVTTWEHGL